MSQNEVLKLLKYFHTQTNDKLAYTKGNKRKSCKLSPRRAKKNLHKFHFEDGTLFVKVKKQCKRCFVKKGYSKLRESVLKKI